MHDDPPQWLKNVVAEHSPAVTGVDGDIMCMGCTKWVNCVVVDGVTWTPDHLARKIHERISDLIVDRFYLCV